MMESRNRLEELKKTVFNYNKAPGIPQSLMEQKVLEGELGSLRKNADVYRQQENSGIFFLSSTSKEKSLNKKKLDSLQKEITELESVVDRSKR